MEKFSVKKPFTVLVAVVAVIALSIVSLTRTTTDLLPEISLPYIVVAVPYPGASPERVESEVVQVMENALGVVSGVENMTSTSAENYGMVQLKFDEDVDMNSTMVKVSSAVEQAKSSLPDGCMTPSIIEMSMDMMATMYIAVDYNGMDVYELSEFTEDVVIPYLERQDGVSSVSSTGLVEKMVQIELNADKIEEVNARILAQVNTALAAAQEKLDDAERQVNEGSKALQTAQASFGEQVSNTLFAQLSEEVAEVSTKIRAQTQDLLDSVDYLIEVVNDPTIRSTLTEVRSNLQKLLDRISTTGVRSLDDLIDIVGQLRVVTGNLSDAMEILKQRVQAQQTEDPEAEGKEDSQEGILDLLRIEQALNSAYTTLEGLYEAMADVDPLMEKMKSAYTTLTQTQVDAILQFASVQSQLETAEEQLAAAKEEYEEAKQSALESANVGTILDIDTLATLVYAQNFSMPAGYIDDETDNSWLLKVGEEYESVEEMAGALLCSMEGVGDIYLSDVADVSIIDNASESYARLNGEQAVLLSIYKGSTYSTNEVSEKCLEAIDELETKYDGLHIVTLMNQGSYITMLIKSVLTSMLVGAALAIIVLALFLKDFKPTVVVGISIPLSVLFAIVLMYFSNISLNMMSLAGLLLGIGMLVDNSIVVMENIYRLRSRGVPAARAAVQGAKQVRGAIVASTLTTICVFFPIVYAQSLTRSLLLPMGICIGYCLAASLLVALTVVPAASSTILRNTKAKPLPWFEKLQNQYARSLRWCLKHKASVLGTAVVLLAFCVWRVLSMGIVMLPDINSSEIQISVTTETGLTAEESYAVATEIMEAVMQVDGVGEVGVMTGGNLTSTLTNIAASVGYSLGGNSYGSYTYYIQPSNSSAGNKEVQRICEDIRTAITGMRCEFEVSAGGITEMASVLGSGLSLRLYGTDLDTLKELSERVMEVVNATEGFTNATNGQGDGDATLELHIDKDKAAAAGLTVAQIYMEIASRLTTSQTSTSVTINGTTMDVVVVDVTDPLTVENLMDVTFTASTLNADGTTTKGTHTLSEFATVETGTSLLSIKRENQTHYMTVTADTESGYNTTVQARSLRKSLEQLEKEGFFPDGYSFVLSGETSTVNDMVEQMGLLVVLGLLLIYLVMVAQFQSLLSPFIVLFTVPLAFTGGLLGLLFTGEQLSLMSLMGFVVLMGTVVNNGIVFVDYANQLRIGGMERREALVATGKTRMRAIIMTALTTILAMVQITMTDDMAGQMMRGMALVIIGGMTYATLMTLYVVPLIYDLLFRRAPLQIDVGGDDLDDVPDDAAEFLAESNKNA
jgi:multidrug efflux pump subunit AcrB